MGAAIVVTDATSTRPAEARGLAVAAGFFFSFRLCIVLLSVHIFGLEPSAGTAVSLGLGLLLFILVCFDALGDVSRSSRALLSSASLRWVIVFLVFTACSLAWSETASLPNSIAYWFGLALDVATVLLLLRSGSLEEDSHSMMKGFIWSTCLLAVIAWVMPTPVDLRLGDEEFFNANEIGNVCAFAIFFAQYLSRIGGGKWRIAKWLLAITLVRSLSKTTLAAFLVSEACLLILDRSMSRRSKALLIASACLLIVLFWGLLEAYYDFYTTTGNQAETLTGRTAIWLYVLGAVGDHPWTMWIGHGFDSWWKVVPPFGGDQFEARHAENEFLQQFYGYGIMGLVILAGLYGSLLRQLRRLPKGPTRVLFLCLLIFIGVRGLAEADSFDLLLPLWSISMVGLLLETQSGTGMSSDCNFSLFHGMNLP